MEDYIDLEDHLYEILITNGPMTRGELVKQTNIPRTTIYDNLVKLMLKGIITRISQSTGRRGRPNVYFKAI